MAIRNIQVTSDEIILPSSPTPPPLRNLKLSLLDQISPSNYTPIIFFYAAVEDPGADRFSGSRQLKKSLSEILTLFYPFAGTLSTEGYSVDCNDKGVEYSEARVDCKLLEVVESPDFKVLHRLLPFEPYANLAEPEIGRDVILAVRLNLFDCGGVAIALCVTHKLVDGLSATVFVREWAAINRGDSDQVPKLTSPSNTISSPNLVSSAESDKLRTIPFQFFRNAGFGTLIRRRKVFSAEGNSGIEEKQGHPKRQDCDQKIRVRQSKHSRTPARSGGRFAGEATDESRGRFGILMEAIHGDKSKLRTRKRKDIRRNPRREPAREDGSATAAEFLRQPVVVRDRRGRG